MAREYCPFHADEDVEGTRLSDGSVSFTCERGRDHPGGVAWSWLAVPEPTGRPNGLGGLAEDLNLADVLPHVLRELGDGWFEYGLVERAYARRDPRGFRQMVERWGHTAIEPKSYTASTYLASTLGRLSSMGLVAYHSGRGTGRWSYNTDISYWSALPPGPWTARTTWEDVVQDATREAHQADEECRSYVGPTT